jgi:hypothetical protein
MITVDYPIMYDALTYKFDNVWTYNETRSVRGGNCISYNVWDFGGKYTVPDANVEAVTRDSHQFARLTQLIILLLALPGWHESGRSNRGQSITHIVPARKARRTQAMSSQPRRTAISS